ncbi:MAG: biotin--[acetyl-CoA-carboxylase] ligase [Lachnospiraceae bacterium]|nr:biotin--[acetyl-CoA-carboxylase] ligase [Lachnospiraceae bacterium]
MKTADLIELLENKAVRHEDDIFLSGQEIADALSLSRTAVWKAIKRAEKEGYEIESKTGLGYRLVDGKNAFSEASISRALNSRWLGQNDKIVFMDSTDSTNEEAKRRTKAASIDEKERLNGTIFVADYQDSGKGRRGRVWELPPGEGIAMSYLLTPEIKPDMAPMMTLIMALSCVSGIIAATGLKSQIKWPNDIVIGGKKIVGILTEMSLENAYISNVIVGTGINVNVGSFPEEIGKNASSLMIEGRQRYSRTELLCRITESFESRYEAFLERGDLGAFLEEYNSICVNAGNRVKVHDPKGEYEGFAKGINERGELIVEKDGGEVLNVYAGEVSVRGVYGYT